MKKLTNEEIAKVFAMYLGCDIEVGLYNYETTLKAVHQSGQIMPYKGPTDYAVTFVSPSVWGMKIKLTPISKITDEHAIEVAKLRILKHGVDINCIDEFSVNRISDLDSIVRYAGPGFSGGVVIQSNGLINYEIITQLFSDEYQCLINTMYAVPLFFSPNHWANGNTAIELGIAIESLK